MRLIDADKLYLEIVEKGQASKRYKIGERWELNGKEIREVVDAQPTVWQRTSHWKPRKHYVSPLHESFVEDYECSNCHFQYGELEWNYCPICGTRMKEDSDDECDLFRRDDDNTIVRTDGKKLYTVDVLDNGEVNAWETRMSRPHREKCWYSDGYEKWVAVVYGRDEKEAKKRAFDLIAQRKYGMMEERGDI
jgi:hypothetical protein